MDFNQSIKNWLITCPEIKKDKMYFNFLKVEDNNQALEIIDTQKETVDILGNEFGKYSFAIIDFRLMEQQPVEFNTKDFTAFANVKKINEWMREQVKNRNYPIMDSGYFVADMQVPPAPTLCGIDQNNGLALAKYMIQVILTYEHYI